MEAKVDLDVSRDAECTQDLANTLVRPRAIYMNIPLFGIAEFWLQKMIPTSTNESSNNKVYIPRASNWDIGGSRMDIKANVLNKQVLCCQLVFLYFIHFIYFCKFFLFLFLCIIFMCLFVGF